MKKEIIIHFSFLVAYFLFISLAKGLFDLALWPFWLGGLLGTMLPDIDHVIYVYYLRPEEYNSQRTTLMASKGKLIDTFKYLAETRSERTRLIFHTMYFQLIFLVLTLYVITSSGSTFGRGLVLAFYLHLFIDQVIDYLDTGGIDSWFKQTPFTLNNAQTKLYLAFIGITILIFGFVL